MTNLDPCQLWYNGWKVSSLEEHAFYSRKLLLLVFLRANVVDFRWALVRIKKNKNLFDSFAVIFCQRHQSVSSKLELKTMKFNQKTKAE